MEDAAPAVGAPHSQRPSPPQERQNWRNFDSSMNAVSFGFVATAILISMFLVMAIFERFLRSASPEFPTASAGRVLRGRDVEARVLGLNEKLGYPSPKMTVYTNGVSVLMPGDQVPTFIAHRAPVPCPAERTPWPPHQPAPAARFVSGPG